MAVIRIGLISDTHGLIRAEALAFLRGSDRILHAGDVGTPAVLSALEALAPVTAVRGNNDRGPWAERLPLTRRVDIGAVTIFIVHDIADLSTDPAAEGFRAVVTGHSHKPSVHERDGVLYVNPGSAGPRRFRLPVSVAELVVEGASLRARLHELRIV